ncbi:MAG: hypothetical protein GF332_02690 [Candidatus Moranbacteria bacterium]|nr:hypothetical protein [Candidatus Moranbacteria bacterium]
MLTTFHLKIIAVFFMVVDHVGYVFFPEHLEFRLLGRLSFPLFAFLIAQGYNYTKNKKSYFFRLLLFALACHFPYALFIQNYLGLNIFFTLLAGFVIIHAFNKIRNRFVFFTILALTGVLAQYFNFDYGFYGVLMIFLFYLSRGSFKKTLITQIILHAIYFALSVLIFHEMVPTNEIVRYPSIIDFIQPFSLLALVFIYLYNYQLGPKIKYFFYWFYPGHLIFLYLLKLLIQA